MAAESSRQTPSTTGRCLMGMATKFQSQKTSINGFYDMYAIPGTPGPAAANPTMPRT
jgi:hypothetical protein